MTAMIKNLAVNYDFHTKYKPVERNKDDAFIDSAAGVADETKSEKGTVMADYYQKKPQYKAVQEKRVTGGYGVMSSYGIEAEDLENMSMGEFKDVIPTIIYGKKEGKRERRNKRNC